MRLTKEEKIILCDFVQCYAEVSIDMEEIGVEELVKYNKLVNIQKKILDSIDMKYAMPLKKVKE